MLVSGYGSRKLTIALATFVIVFFILYTYINPSWGYDNVAPPKPPTDGEGRSTNPAAKRPGGADLNTPEKSDQDDADGPPPPSPRSRISQKFQEYLSWDPPLHIKKHYPPYGEYLDRDYDPNRWEVFEQNNEIYTNATLRKLKPSQTHPSPYDPYPAYNSEQWRREWRGTYVPCNGPKGRPFDKFSDEVVRAYKGVPEGFPTADCGSFEAVGLDDDVCFDRYSRLGPYGVTKQDGGRAFGANVNWMKLQNDCLELNKDRYQFPNPPMMAPEDPKEVKLKPRQTQEQPLGNGNSLQYYKPRTAILIRTWDNYKYGENDVQAIRSLITELNLLSGGEYHVFLFVNIKDPTIPVFTERKSFEEKLAEFVPEGLRDIAILWTEAVGYSWYNSVGEWSVYFQQFMPVQWFSQTHPEYEYIWNWEMDARYIGQHYHFLEQITKFARDQPRKYLWERNARYYFPSKHGSYDDFVKDTNRIVAESPHVESVWGPQKWKPEQEALGPTPPTTEQEDNFSWGVGEEADFITLLPMWDPRHTLWSYRDKLWGYPRANDSTEAKPFLHVPRRTFINTLVRVSKNLLEAMHRENLGGVSMASEMWPSSTALHHGFKAVYAPHPIWFAQHWQPDYLENVINADGWGAGGGKGDEKNGRGAAYDEERESAGLPQQGTGPNREGKLGRWTQERDSPYNPDREHNFAGWSWYFWSDFPRVIYWRWLGWMASFDIVTIEGRLSNDAFQNVSWYDWEEENGRMCLPGMLLHPVKEVEPPKGTKVSTTD